MMEERRNGGKIEEVEVEEKEIRRQIRTNGGEKVRKKKERGMLERRKE